jgi:hypothetical protein
VLVSQVSGCTKDSDCPSPIYSETCIAGNCRLPGDALCSADNTCRSNVCMPTGLGGSQLGEKKCTQPGPGAACDSDSAFLSLTLSGRPPSARLTSFEFNPQHPVPTTRILSLVSTIAARL